MQATQAAFKATLLENTKVTDYGLMFDGRTKKGGSR